MTDLPLWGLCFELWRTEKDSILKFSDSRFTQQELPACKPILTPRWVIFFFIFGFIWYIFRDVISGPFVFISVCFCRWFQPLCLSALSSSPLELLPSLLHEMYVWLRFKSFILFKFIFRISSLIVVN